MSFEVRVDRVAAGGDGLATAPDGRVVFVPDSLPGDHLLVHPTQQKKQFIRARIGEILEPSPDRVDPPCRHVAEGCGGCDWQHAPAEAQARLRVELVQDALRRIAKIDDLPVTSGAALSPNGYRTTARLAVHDGRAGFRRRRSNDVLVPDHCLVLHPRIDELVRTVDFGPVEEVVVRVAARTGERLVHTATDVDLDLPGDVVVSSDLRPAAIIERIHDRPYRVSGPSFFQCRPDGAEIMIDVVAEAIAGVDGPLVDAYAGVGLFGAALGHDRPLTSIESSSSSVADSRVNLPQHATIVESTVESWTPTPAAAVIADPARAGLGTDGVAALVGTGAEIMALVSCDAAAMARDLRLLVDAGYDPQWSKVVDLFGHTSHVEVITQLRRR